MKGPVSALDDVPHGLDLKEVHLSVQEGALVQGLLCRGGILRLSLPGLQCRFLQGTADADVPVSVALRLLDHVSGPDIRLTLVKGADHRFSTPDCLALIVESVEEVLAPAPPRRARLGPSRPSPGASSGACRGAARGERARLLIQPVLPEGWEHLDYGERHQLRRGIARHGYPLRELALMIVRWLEGRR